MATNYINTGVIGQYLGGTLGSGSVGAQFQDYAEGVKRKKRKLSGPTLEERQAVRERQQERAQQSIVDTTLKTPEGEVVRQGVSVDTADVKVPTVPARTAQEAAQVAAAPPPAPTITKAPVQVRTPSPAASARVTAPEKTYGATDVAFVQAFDRYYQEVQSKNSSAVNSGRGALQGLYGEVTKAAKASGRKEYIELASQAGLGVANAKDISSKNVGQAKAATASARSSIRSLVDLDKILRENPLQAAPVAAPAVSTNVVNMGTARTQVRSKRNRFGFYS